MLGGYEGGITTVLKAFSETDFTEDLKRIDIPVLVMHGDDDQIVPIVAAGSTVRQNTEESHAQGLSRLSTWDARDQRGPKSTPTCWRSLKEAMRLPR